MPNLWKFRWFEVKTSNADDDLRWRNSRLANGAKAHEIQKLTAILKAWTAHKFQPGARSFRGLKLRNGTQQNVASLKPYLFCKLRPLVHWCRCTKISNGMKLRWRYLERTNHDRYGISRSEWLMKEEPNKERAEVQPRWKSDSLLILWDPGVLGPRDQWWSVAKTKGVAMSNQTNTPKNLPLV